MMDMPTSGNPKYGVECAENDKIMMKMSGCWRLLSTDKGVLQVGSIIEVAKLKSGNTAIFHGTEHKTMNK